MVSPQEVLPSPPRRVRGWPAIFAWLLGLLAAAALGGWMYLTTLDQPVQPGSTQKVAVTIGAGMSSRDIGELLADKGLIRQAWFFRLYLGQSGQDRDLRTGTYLLSPGMSLQAIVAELIKGRPAADIEVTIPEGYTLKQIAEALAKKGLMTTDEFKHAASQDYPLPFLAKLPKGEKRLEGFLFPDTYRFKPGTQPREVVQDLLQRFAAVYQEESRGYQGPMSQLEIVTLASIVEREAKVDAERPVIAAVFLNRLKRGMRLQSCATVEYLLPEPKDVLTQADLAIKSPYNTYQADGLPPGPIAAPGRVSLRAVFQPAQADYLYFVVKPDGSHAFSRTLAEHNRAAAQYLK